MTLDKLPNVRAEDTGATQMINALINSINILNSMYTNLAAFTNAIKRAYFWYSLCCSLLTVTLFFVISYGKNSGWAMAALIVAFLCAIRAIFVLHYNRFIYKKSLDLREEELANAKSEQGVGKDS